MQKIQPLNKGQQTAVESRGASILVSAPAGSGKTKILVSRILSLLEDDGYHIEQLLVLTFTNAAALEMKQRLEQDLEKRLQNINNPKIKQHLLQQKQKLPTAYITNFHGFCSTLLKQYGYLIGIPNTFEIMSDPLLVQHQILDNCISSWLEDKAFRTFIATNFNEYHFKSFKSLILKLYTLSHNFVDFNTYKKELKDTIYQPIIDKQPISRWSLASHIIWQLKTQAMEGRNKVIELRNYCQKHGLTFFYNNPYDSGKNKELPTPYDCYLKFFHTIQVSLTEDTLEDIIAKGVPTLDRSYRAKFDDDTRPYQKEYNAKKAMITKGYTALFDDLLYPTIDEFSKIMQLSYETLATLFTYVESFNKKYKEYKLEHSMLDFNDLETYAHTLLSPKYHVVDALHQQLKEIMIDEYQDTNQIQETLITKIAKYQQPSIPCFMVGDMKQSIYKFRGGDPDIFNQKYLTYNTNYEALHTKRIDLAYNYRSNKIVLDSVNYICNQIMDQEIGGLDYYYDESAKLNYDYLRKEGATSFDEEIDITKQAKKRLHNETRFTTEILLMEKNKAKDITTAEKEAIVIAKRIEELVGKFELDDYQVTTRIAQYNDIVVLMRNTTEFITFKKVFDRFQIPNQIVLSQGFLQTQEIINSIHVLKAIDNHLDDIAMVSLLKGNYKMSHFDEQLLTDIRQDKTISMYDNLVLYIKNKDLQYERVETFLDYYHQLVAFSKSHTVKETMAKFFQDSQYPLFVSSLINGKQRYANLELLIEHLSQQTKGLHAVVTDYLRAMEHGVQMAPGQVLSTNSNTVSFMTIHKSKGLEFPIVFISQLHKQFNKQESRERMVMDKHLGIAIKPRVMQNVEPYENVTIEYENKYRKLIARAQIKEQIDEEMRIFYVALTRASQKLILTGAIDTFSTIVSWQQKVINNEDADIIRQQGQDHVLLYRNIRNASSYLEWLGVSIVRHPHIIRQCKEKQFMKQLDDTLSEQLKQNADTLHIYSNPNNHYHNTEHAKFHLHLITEEMIAQYSHQTESPTQHINTQTYQKYANFSYPKKENLIKTMAVTKKIEDGDRQFIKVVYDTESHTTIKANDRGTLIHRVLEQLPLEPSIDIDCALQKIYEQNNYTNEQIKVINSYRPQLENFIQSDVYFMLLQSQQTYREKSFTLKDENGQIIHGIFDVITITDNNITIIDYKTDRLAKTTSIETLKQLHKPQIDYYKKVLRKVFPNNHIQAIVYYLYINTYVTL